MITKIEYTLFAVVVIVAFALLWFVIPTEDLTTFNIVSLISTLISFVGFYITIKQIVYVKKTTEEIDIAVNRKLTTFNKMLLLSDVSSKISLINEIKGHLRKEKLEVSVVRMEDLKKVMATIVPNAAILSLEINERSLNQILKNFSIDMNTIEKKMLNNSYQIETDKIIGNMDKMSTYLLMLEAELKQN